MIRCFLQRSVRVRLDRRCCLRANFQSCQSVPADQAVPTGMAPCPLGLKKRAGRCQTPEQAGPTCMGSRATVGRDLQPGFALTPFLPGKKVARQVG